MAIRCDLLKKSLCLQSVPFPYSGVTYFEQSFFFLLHNIMQVKMLVQLLGGTIVPDQEENVWESSMYSNMQRLIIVPDKLSKRDLRYLLVHYCLRDCALPRTTWFRSYNKDIDCLEHCRSGPSPHLDSCSKAVPIVYASWLADSISAYIIAPLQGYCCGVACWE